MSSAVTETQVRAGSPSGISWEPAAADTPEERGE
jgi:hypothetical protein